MAKGKKKVLTVVEPKPEEACKTNKVETGTKENKPEGIACHGQSTMHSFLSPSKSRSLRDSPLSPIHEENSSATCNVPNETHKPGEVRQSLGTSEFNAPRRENLGTQCPPCGSTEKTSPPHQEDAISGTTPQPKQERVLHTKVKVNKSALKKCVAEGKDFHRNRKVTDYYPIRRSSRKSKAELKCEEQRHLDDLIKNGVEGGLKIKYTEGKGRGVFAERDFCKGQFVVEYHGDLLLMDDAKKREALYAQDPATGCYMYYFQYLSKTYCVDATKETNRLGRLINHSKNGNCQTRVHSIKDVPHLILVASRDIKVDEELLYDYGDRSRAAIAAHPWLKQ